MQHAIMISPVSQLPTIVSTNSLTYSELMQAGYQVTNYGTKKQMEEIEEELMQDFYSDLELNNSN